MSTVSFEFLTNQGNSPNARRVAATVVRLLNERKPVGPICLTPGDYQTVAEMLNAEDGQPSNIQWDWQEVEYFLNGCRFVNKCDDAADVAALVASYQTELEQLRADLGLVHRYAVALEARIKQLEGGE